MDKRPQRAETEAMKRIPFTKSVIFSERDVEEVIQALTEATDLNYTLLRDWMAAEAKLREYAGLIVTQSEASQQIMEINTKLSDAIGRIRGGEDVDTVVNDLTATLSEFGG